MSESQSSNQDSAWIRVSGRQRLIAGLWFAGVIGTGLLLVGLQKAHFNFTLLLGTCGLKQRTGLPCPTCGMTHAVLAFARGQWLLAWTTQPAAALFCTLLLAVALGGLAVALTGWMPVKIQRFYAELKWRYVLILGGIVVLAGWAVTFSRAWMTLHGGAW